MKKQLLLLLAAIMLSSCGKPATAPPATAAPTAASPTHAVEVPLPTVTPACISQQPSQDDIDRALSFTGATFAPSEWEQTHTVGEDRVSVTWLNSPLGAVAYLEAVIFPCGYEEPDLNNYYSDTNWGNVFQYYESYELAGECKRDDGLRLYEFKTHNQGFEYGVNYWVKSDTDTRVISMMIVFPLELDAMMGDYSTQLFPTYASCP
jgi:hypothetical protein